MIRIYGASDDLVEIEGQTDEEISSDDLVIVVGNEEAQPGQDSSGVRVRMRYAASWHGTGCWSAEVVPLDEDVAIPWPVTIRAEGYTAVVEIDCPDDTPLTWPEEE